VRDFRAGRMIPVLSDVTAAEVLDAPTAVRNLHQELLAIAEAVLPLTEDVLVGGLPTREHRGLALS
jgi:hypothetical protein